MNRIQWARMVGPIILALMLAFPLTLGATTWTVETGGSIGSALGMAAAGDTVLVDCGTYEEQGLFLPDGVVLRSLAGQTGCTAIATAGGAPALTCEAPGLTSRVESITFIVAAGGLTAPVVRGGGVYAEGASTVFVDCVFEGLEAAYGGAVYCRDGALRFVDCAFFGNRALASGGALNAVGDAAPSFEGCLMVDNEAGVSGGAVNAALGAAPSLLACTLVGHAGGGLSGWDSGACGVERSIVSDGDAAYLGDAESAPSFICCDIWGNGADWTGPLAGQELQDGNLSADPLFCPVGTSIEEYALAESSPCAPVANPTCGLLGARAVGCDSSVGNGGGETPPEGGEVPEVTRLRHSYPNPFNPVTTVRFELRRDSRAKVCIFDAAGRLVRQLLDEERTAGGHEITWQGRSDDGRSVAAGVYFIRLESDGLVDMQRVTLVK